MGLGTSMKKKPTDAEIVSLWKATIISRGSEIDAEADKGGHDWHSIWTGFVLALGRPDLTSYAKYMKLGFPEEKNVI